jgi:hypothetical protein
MGLVKINKSFYVDLDKHNKTLHEVRFSKKRQKEIDSIRGHFKNWTGVMNAILEITINRKVELKEEVTLKELIQITEESTNKINNFCKENLDKKVKIANEK